MLFLMPTVALRPKTAGTNSPQTASPPDESLEAGRARSALQTLTGVGADWPIEHADLIRCVVEAEEFLGVSDPANYQWDPSRRYPLPPGAGNAPAEAMAPGCAALGIPATDAPAALVPRNWDRPHWGRR